MKSPTNLILAALLLVSGALAALQGRNIDSIREGQAFYEWIIAVGTHDRLFGDDEVRTKRTAQYENDVAFLAEVEKACKDSRFESVANRCPDLEHQFNRLKEAIQKK